MNWTFGKDFVKQVGRISNKTKVNVNACAGTSEDYVNENIWLRGQFSFLTRVSS